MPANRPYIIGLTGGIASGKSTAAEALEQLGAVQIDADRISHELTADGGEALPEIREVFSDDVFTPDGALDRKALAARIFEDPAARRALEGIIHPRVQRCMMRAVDEAAEQGEKIVFLNVPLLFETGMDALCDETWLVAVTPEHQLARVMQRDGLTEEEALSRIASQMSLEKKAARATIVINNDHTPERLKAEVTNLYHGALKRLNS